MRVCVSLMFGSQGVNEKCVCGVCVARRSFSVETHNMATAVDLRPLQSCKKDSTIAKKLCQHHQLGFVVTPPYFMPQYHQDVKTYLPRICVLCDSVDCLDHDTTVTVKEDGAIKLEVPKYEIEAFWTSSSVATLRSLQQLSTTTAKPEARKKKKDGVVSYHLYTRMPLDPDNVSVVGNVRFTPRIFQDLQEATSWCDSNDYEVVCFEIKQVFSLAPCEFIDYLRSRFSENDAVVRYLLSNTVSQKFALQPLEDLTQQEIAVVTKEIRTLANLADDLTSLLARSRGGGADDDIAVTRKLLQKNLDFLKIVQSRWKMQSDRKAPCVRKQFGDILNVDGLVSASSARLTTIPSAGPHCSVSMADSKSLLISLPYTPDDQRCLRALRAGPKGVGGALQVVTSRRERLAFMGLPFRTDAKEWADANDVQWILASPESGEEYYFSRNPIDNYRSVKFLPLRLRPDESCGLGVMGHHIAGMGMDFDGDEANLHGLLQPEAREHARSILAEEKRGAIDAMGQVALPLSQVMQTLLLLDRDCDDGIFFDDGITFDIERFSNPVRSGFRPEPGQALRLLRDFVVDSTPHVVSADTSFVCLGHLVAIKEEYARRDYCRAVDDGDVASSASSRSPLLFDTCVIEGRRHYLIHADFEDTLLPQDLHVGDDDLFFPKGTPCSRSTTSARFYVATDKIHLLRQIAGEPPHHEDCHFLTDSHLVLALSKERISLYFWKLRSTFLDNLGDLLHRLYPELKELLLPDGRQFYRRDGLVVAHGELASRCTCSGPNLFQKKKTSSSTYVQPTTNDIKNIVVLVQTLGFDATELQRYLSIACSRCTTQRRYTSMLRHYQNVIEENSYVMRYFQSLKEAVGHDLASWCVRTAIFK